MATAQTVLDRFLTALEGRDWDALGACFAPDAKLRALVPTALREADGGGAIADRFAVWFADLQQYELLESGVSPFVDRVHVSYRVRGIDPEDGDTIVEQRGYATVDDDRIAALNLVCSGFRPA
jgi:hypothetical protein